MSVQSDCGVIKAFLRRKWGKITVQTFNKAKSVQGSENEHENTFT